MKPNDYQIEARKTALEGNDTIEYMAIGLSNEVGELMGIIKKGMRGDILFQNPEYVDKKILGEAGDVLWYLTNLLSHFDLSLEDVMRENLGKVQRRYIEDKIRGNGDDR